MIAISSFKPLNESAEIAINQIRAHRSWCGAFDQILYFGDKDQRLNSPRTSFVESERFPRICTLVGAAALSKDLACIINSDIVVDQRIRNLQFEYSRFGGIRTWHGLAYTSRRYEYDPGTFNLNAASLVDQGIDIFVAYPHVWRKCWRQIPEGFRIGNSGWDNWMMDWFRRNYGAQFKDVTDQKLIFHPRHYERRRLF